MLLSDSSFSATVFALGGAHKHKNLALARHLTFDLCLQAKPWKCGACIAPAAFIPVLSGKEASLKVLDPKSTGAKTSEKPSSGGETSWWLKLDLLLGL